LHKSRELRQLTYEDVLRSHPTLNEAESVGSVIKEFRRMGFDNILVIDATAPMALQKWPRRLGQE
jgi:hypothetical protein